MRRQARDVSLTIANGQQDSDVLDVRNAASGTFTIPAAFTGVAMTFKICNTPDGTFVDLYNAANALISITVAVSRSYPIPAEALGAMFVRLRSGAAEGAARTVVVQLKD